MQLTDDRLLLSPSDLSGFLACRHLTRLEMSVARGEQKRPIFDDPHREILGRRGVEHEKSYLARTETAGTSVLRVPTIREEGFTPEGARRLTEEAIRKGSHDVIYQAYLADGDWQGFADFLERREDGSYEPVDAKLARAARPEHVLQLCFYAEQIERIQGRLPHFMHAELGSGERESFRTAEYMAYYRRVRSRFLEALRDSAAETYPWPCDRCGICSWRRKCHEKLVADDNLVLVAGLGRTYVPRLEAVGLRTLEKLGDARADHARDGLAAEIFDKFRHQASLQLSHRRTGKHQVELLEPEPGRGFDLMPAPSPGDVWLDLEGHPFFEPNLGLEYLFGYCVRSREGKPAYRSLWATDRKSEKGIFEQFVDFVVERRRQFPDMHVYHYASYERTALQRLMGVHGTREEEIDDLLRGEVLVDLYRVVQQSLRASVESYSLKKVEALYGFKREAGVKGGAESTVLFERWLEVRDQSLLDEIALYNEEDCRSTFDLHEWLIGLRPEGAAWRPLPVPAPVRQDAKLAEERERVKGELLARSRQEGDVPWLLAQILEYHKREARPQWWHWYNRLEMDDEELIRDTSTMGGLTVKGTPTTEKRSHVYTFTFPPQDHKIEGNVVDPASRKGFRAEVDEENGLVRLKRDQSRSNEPLPRALVPQAPIPDNAQREALLRFAKSFLEGNGAYPALADLVARRPPRADLALAPPEAALTLDRSYLFVQGPPGSGKTWQGAKAAVALMRNGLRIGVTALSHKAINKLLSEIEREAAAQGFAFRGRKKHTEEDDAHRGPFIESSDKTEDMLDRTVQLIAGTGWLFSRKEFDHSLDVLFIDEAGQVSLADAIASGTAAHSLVLLGDPNQLPQVSQGVQPEAAKKSVLEHLLGEHHTVPKESGIFLEKTWRLRPELCAFNSEAYYEERLQPAAVAAERSLGAGNGLHVRAVEHESRSQSSREEAQAVAAEIRRLIGTSFTEASGRSRSLTAADVLVVTPYNAQVRMIRSLVPEGVRVGTVDKFQGQEAAVVLVSFASSSGADAPRGIGFAFEPHRVNVATSRGQCRVVVFCAPDLLQAECHTIEQMKLMNAICRFVELAQLS